MIVPLVDEPEWMHALAGLPAFEVEQRPILLVAPHPDDETLGAGGLVAALSRRGVEIRVLAVTDGEHAYPESPAIDCAELGALRVREQTSALARLGVPEERILRLHLPDSSVAAHEDKLLGCLQQLATHSTHIIAPWRGDFHPDHEACGRAAEEAARRTGARLSSYLFWTWHRGLACLLQRLPLRSFALSAADLEAKTAALAEHRSQLAHPLQSARGSAPAQAERVTVTVQTEPEAAEADLAILPERLLAPARRNFEVFFD